MCEIFDFIFNIIDLCLSFAMNIIVGCFLVVAFILMWVLYGLSGCGTIGNMQQPTYGNGFVHKSSYFGKGGGGGGGETLPK